MKSKTSFFVGIAIALGMAALGYFWAMAVMDSLYTFRSPLANNPPAAGPATGEPLTRRVVVVLIDALRYDTAANPQVMPFLNELRTRGASAKMHSRPPSFSQTGYTMIFTGAWADIADAPLVNLEDDQVRAWTQDNLFSAAHRAGLKTAVSGYFWFETQIPVPVDATFYTPGYDAAADVEVLDAAIPMLQDPAYALVLIHIDQVDYAGHYEGGPRNPSWDAAATRSDDMLKTIVSQLDLEQDTVLVISDHGQLDQGGHGGPEAVTLSEPFVLAGKGVRTGDFGDVEMIDVAPTLAALLGVNIPASSQGRVLMDLLDAAPGQAGVIRSAEAAQKAALYEAYTLSIGVAGDAPPTVTDPALSFAQSIESAQQTRLGLERGMRLGIAGVIFLILAAVVYWQFRNELWALLIGAALFLVLFNIRYLWLSERTYSLASVASADDIINYTAITAGIAFALVWLGYGLVTGMFGKKPFEAARKTLALTLVTLFVLGTFMLVYFTINGTVITWTLPEFYSMFLGFLSMIQIIITAAAGLVLTGLTALAAFARQKFAS